MLRRFLVDAGYQVITATDGHAALAEFQAQRPDVVVLEWQLPGLDGIGVIRRIRETDATPILMLAAVPRSRIESLRWTVGQMIIWPSRITRLSCWHTCVPSSGGRTDRATRVC